MRKPNPFPEYAVTRLLDLTQAESIHQNTASTEEIEAAEAAVKDYLKSLEPQEPAQGPLPAVMVAVRGDYGTGKTHLLLESAATLREKAAAPPTVLRLIAQEASPSAWLRLQQSDLKALPFQEMVLDLYYDTAIEVLKSSPLTKGYADDLLEDRTLLRPWIEDGKVNESVIQDRFQANLSRVCTLSASDDVQTALAGLMSNLTSEVAQSWLAGAELPPGHILNLRQPMAGDSELLSILASAAALHRHAGKPFALLIDELEHFANIDRKNSEKRNLTWLKRLLEALSPFRPLVMVAGYSDAWFVEPNLLDRFTRQIRMVVLSPEEILKLLRKFVPGLPETYEAQAAAIQRATGGRIRDVVTLCSRLWSATNGFEEEIDPDTIIETARRMGTGLTAARALDEMQSMLQERNFEVRRSANVATNANFDLVATEGGVPGVVADFRHAVTQESNVAQLGGFLAKVKLTLALYPNVLACFVVDGNTDPDLDEIARSKVRDRIRYFDVNTPGVLTQMRTALERRADAPAVSAGAVQELVDQTRIVDRQILSATGSGNEAVLKELREQRLALDNKLDSIAGSATVLEKRIQTLETSRLASVPPPMPLVPQPQAVKYVPVPPANVGPRPSAAADREEAISEALSAPKEVETVFAEIIDSYSKQPVVRLAASRLAFWCGALLVIVGVVFAMFVTDLFPPMFDRNGVPVVPPATLASRIGMWALSLIALVGGLYLMSSTILGALRFLEHARRLLREIYHRVPNAEDLSTADSLLQEALAEYGPTQATYRAREILARRFPFLNSSAAGPAQGASPAQAAADSAGS